MAKQKSVPNTDVLFFRYLWDFYRANRTVIRRSYKRPTKNFLDFNDPENGDAFLRPPQFEALEIYVFLKEGLDNAPVWRIFDDWLQKRNLFESRSDAFALRDEQGELFGNIDAESYAAAFRTMRASAQDYLNYIFALTMGVGKTILMGTCIFYEFILARAYPKDPRFCHNVLIFAPDTTVLQSLREIIDFDRSRVVPPEYVDLLNANLKFWFLEDSSMTLNVQEGSMFNVVISNAQKIIIRTSHQEKSGSEQLFAPDVLAGSGAQARLNKLLGIDAVVSENDLAPNQRFQKLLRLEQLGIFVDEAHHAFGKELARDMGAEKDTRTTSLRKTIAALAAAFRAKGSRVVACYNYTGTPYAGGKIFPEVVYAYGLRPAIDHEHLKKARVVTYDNVKSADFIEDVLRDFFTRHRGKRYEGTLPKIAFFASTIDELEAELRPEVERVMSLLDLPVSSILVNHQKASSDQIREFHRLDTPGSSCQVILLVNKGKEGWNCRSLFGVALYRKPKSKIFVLQASMRCLRRIDFPPQHAGSIYLSAENAAILDAELQANFRLSVEALNQAGSTKVRYQVRPVPPPRRVKVRRSQTLFDVRRKTAEGAADFKLRGLDETAYESRRTVRETLLAGDAPTIISEELAPYGATSFFTPLTLVAECARYLGYSVSEEGATLLQRGGSAEKIGLRPVQIERILRESVEGIDLIVETVNRHNEILYDVIIPGLFNHVYLIKEHKDTIEEEINLVEIPESGVWNLNGEPKLTQSLAEAAEVVRPFTYHLDHYIFDSKPEVRFYNDMLELLGAGKVRQIYFTGMLTHGQSKFNVPYIDPETHSLRTYYPDFLIEVRDGNWVIVEVKGAHQIDTDIVRAKAEYARFHFSTGLSQGGTTFEYCLLSDLDIMDGRSGRILAQQLPAYQEAFELGDA